MKKYSIRVNSKNKKQKLVFCTEKFFPHIGGVEKHVLNISKYLSSKYQITILTKQLNNQAKLSQRLDNQLSNLKIIRIPQTFTASKIKLWQWIWKHKEQLIQQDIVHIHDVFWWIIPIIPFLKNGYYITFHGWEGVFPPKLTAVWQRKLAEKLAKKTIHIGQYIEKWYKTKAQLTTYGATDILLKTTTHQSQADKIVFLGRLDPVNDIDLAIAFWLIYKQKHPQAQIIWCGDGLYRKQCQKYGSVTGMVNNPNDYLNTAEIVIANSYLSILEAMATKKITISFYNNQLKKDYLIFHPQSKQMIIENSAIKAYNQLQKLKNNPLIIEQRLIANYHWAETQTWQKLSSQYLSIYQQR